MLHTVVYTFAVVKALGPRGTFQHRERGPWRGGGGHSAVPSISQVTSLFFLSFFVGVGFLFSCLQEASLTHTVCFSETHISVAFT